MILKIHQTGNANFWRCIVTGKANEISLAMYQQTKQIYDKCDQPSKWLFIPYINTLLQQ